MIRSGNDQGHKKLLDQLFEGKLNVLGTVLTSLYQILLESNYERISYTLIESSDESRLGPFLIVKPSGLFVSEGQGSLRPPVNASVFWSKVGQTVRLFNSKVYRAFQNNLEGES